MERELEVPQVARREVEAVGGLGRGRCALGFLAALHVEVIGRAEAHGEQEEQEEKASRSGSRGTHHGGA